MKATECMVMAGIMIGGFGCSSMLPKVDASRPEAAIQQPYSQNSPPPNETSLPEPSPIGVDSSENPPPPNEGQSTGKFIPWGTNINLIGVGIPFGKAAAPSAGVYKPSVTIGMSGLFSLWYGYAAAGFSYMKFHDSGATSVDVVDLNTGETRAQGNSASALAGFVELGATHGFLINLGKSSAGENSYLELMPSLGYGIEGVGSIDRDFAQCVDCPSQQHIPVDYKGGQYARVMLGTFWAGGLLLRGRFGVTMSYQRFLTPSGHGLTDQLNFWLTVGLAKSK